MAGPDEVVGDEQADVAGPRDRDTHQSSPPDSMCACNSSTAATSDTNTSTSPSWPIMSLVTICALPNRVTAVSQNRPGRLRSASFFPTALGGICRSISPTAPVGSTQSLPDLRRQQTTQHLVGRPRDGGDGRDAEPLVDQRAARVVDAGDDVLDAVGLACDAGAEDVGVVAAGDRRERAGLVDAGDREVVAVEAEADDGLAAEVVGQTAERARVLVDDGHGVVRLFECAGQLAAHPAAADDDDVHLASCSPWREGRDATARAARCAHGAGQIAVMQRGRDAGIPASRRPGGMLIAVRARSAARAGTDRRPRSRNGSCSTR